MAVGVDTWITRQHLQQLQQLEQQQYHQQQQLALIAKKKEEQFNALNQRQKRSRLARQAALSDALDITATTSKTLLPPSATPFDDDDDGIPQALGQEDDLQEAPSSNPPQLPLVNSTNNLNLLLANSHINGSGSLQSLPATSPVLSTTALHVHIG